VRLKTVNLTNFILWASTRFGVDASTKELYWLYSMHIEYNRRTHT
jgi:hypothetical protein